MWDLWSHLNCILHNVWAIFKRLPWTPTTRVQFWMVMMHINWKIQHSDLKPRWTNYFIMKVKNLVQEALTNIYITKEGSYRCADVKKIEEKVPHPLKGHLMTLCCRCCNSNIYKHLVLLFHSTSLFQRKEDPKTFGQASTGWVFIGLTTSQHTDKQLHRIEFRTRLLPSILLVLSLLAVGLPPMSVSFPSFSPFFHRIPLFFSFSTSNSFSPHFY